MAKWFSDLFIYRGEIGRGKYAAYGLVLFAIKYNLDRIVSASFQKKLTPWNYIFPAENFSAWIAGSDSKYYLILSLLAVPFICIGILLTIRRLRSVGLPAWLCLLFFFPIVNLLFFLILCLMPGKDDQPVPEMSQRMKFRVFLDRVIPDSSWGSAALGIFLNVLSALLFTQFSVQALSKYGLGLFIGLPFSLGFTSVLIYTYHWRQSLWNCLKVSMLSILLAGAVFFAAAMEGIACLVMAAPLALLLAMVGGSIAYAIQSRPRKDIDTGSIYTSLILAVPLLMGIESTEAPVPQLHRVMTSIEIDAPPEKVWKHVVSFSELPPPDEMLFRIGIAYPMRAQIQGSGVGAIRHCVFSTGSFVEPISVWNESRLLKFSVTSNPAPMQEWTLYSKIHPPHLKSFLVSQGGQFELKQLPNGKTILEGTTWYNHNMQPELYWKLWADQIIHQIHLRVLNHVKSLSENT
jgi:uncharacterized membrane protein YhaH (DUF805 family)